MNRSDPGLLLVVSAPSGGGKTTTCVGLLECRSSLSRVVTCTTRAPRGAEQHGVDYLFLSKDEFQQRIGENGFLEHANVYGNFYGTPRKEVLEQLSRGAHLILSVDVQGVASIQAQAREIPELARALVTVFLAPPSLATLEQRLRNRNQDTPEVIRRRLAEARAEIEHAGNFDYVIVSGSIQEDLNRMRSIFDAETLRQGRVRLPNYETL